MNLLEQKKQLRDSLKRRRKALSDKERLVKSKKISDLIRDLDDFKTAKSLFCFISYLDEVHTHNLIDSIFEAGKFLAVPKIISKTEMLAVPIKDWSDLEPDKMGILTPRSSENYSDHFDLAITPGLGFTLGGDRIGYGRGYYDRWFSANNVTCKLGVAYGVQIVEQLPVSDTDIQLDKLVTEEGILSFK